MEKLRKAIFLDRDGVINKNDGGYILDWEQFEFLPGVMEAMFELYQMNYDVFVVSNQSGISKGLSYNDKPVTSSSIYRIFDRMHNDISKYIKSKTSAKLPIVIRDVKVCPHLPEHNCACRKPKPGMIYSLAVRWDIDLSKSWMIGDQDSDMEAGRNAGIRKKIQIVADVDDYTPPHEAGTYRPLDWATKDCTRIHADLLNAVRYIQDADKWEADHV